MDGQRFDHLTRKLAHGLSRRAVARAGVGLIVGATLGRLGLRDAAAGHRGRPLGAGCLKNANCASGICDRSTHRCICPADRICGSSCCADCFLQTDPDTGAQTPFCCPAGSVCAGPTIDPADDQCCWFDEVCFAPNTTCCRSNQDGTCTVEANCAGCCRTCGTDGAGNPLCCDQTEQCVTDGQGNKTCESLNTARLNRARR